LRLKKCKSRIKYQILFIGIMYFEILYQQKKSIERLLKYNFARRMKGLEWTRSIQLRKLVIIDVKDLESSVMDFMDEITDDWTTQLRTDNALRIMLKKTFIKFDI